MRLSRRSWLSKSLKMVELDRHSFSCILFTSAFAGWQQRRAALLVMISKWPCSRTCLPDWLSLMFSDCIQRSLNWSRSLPGFTAMNISVCPTGLICPVHKPDRMAISMAEYVVCFRARCLCLLLEIFVNPCVRLTDTLSF